jgi:ABC-type lipoprotein export system ATPase subunit
MIQLKDVTKTYQGDSASVAALKGIDLQIDAGEFVALTGPSGCGKSTLLHIIGGLDRADAGIVEVCGIPLHSATEKELVPFRRRHVGMIFQFFHLLPSMRVIENVSLPLMLDGTPYFKARPAAEELLETVGLPHRANHFPHQLSGGEMQRVSIARALIHKPSVLLGDEPTGNLDTTNAAAILELLRTVNVKYGTTLLLATHSNEVAAAAARTLSMRDGAFTESAA